ncbi:MAG: hypothetical protein KAU94_00075 [Verrucomicrobia bacterium]|nr:hypothetical protein [Verrucomicrobiota bacterium]
MKKRKLILSVCTLTLLLAYTASASVIGWNFTSNWPNPTIQGDGLVDGFDQWTDSVDAGSPGGQKVVNSTDTWAVTTPINATMVSVAWSSSGMYSAGSETNPDQGLYRVYLDDGGAGPTVTVSGLSAWLATVPGATGYKVDFYRCADVANNTFAELNIYAGTGTGGTQLESLAAELAAGDGAYPTGTGGGGSRLKQSATGTFTADIVTFHTDRNLGGGSRAGLAGFKITTIPEPATFGTLAVFGGGILFIRRRLML